MLQIGCSILKKPSTCTFQVAKFKLANFKIPLYSTQLGVILCLMKEKSETAIADCIRTRTASMFSANLDNAANL